MDSRAAIWGDKRPDQVDGNGLGGIQEGRRVFIPQDPAGVIPAVVTSSFSRSLERASASGAVKKSFRRRTSRRPSTQYPINGSFHPPRVSREILAMAVFRSHSKEPAVLLRAK